MGTMVYGVAPAIEIEDRTLFHLQTVMIAKLRRHESFMFSWSNELDVGYDQATGRRVAHGAVWVSPSSLLYFSYDAPERPDLNPAWVESLTRVANSNGGLRSVPEPAAV